MLKNVYVWNNGMVMVFDENGQQMPDYQGTVEEVFDKIEKDKTNDTIFHGRWDKVHWAGLSWRHPEAPLSRNV